MKVPEGSLLSPHVQTQLCTANSGLEVELTRQGMWGYHPTSQEGLDTVATHLQLRAERIGAKRPLLMPLGQCFSNFHVQMYPRSLFKTMPGAALAPLNQNLQKKDAKAPIL